MRTQQVFGGPTDLPGSAGALLSWTSRATTSRILTQCLTWHKMSSASERVCQALPARARMRIGRFTVDGWRTSPGMDPCMDPPEVEDQPGQAIREDTPGYIPKVLPKLIPYGTGDYHCDKPGLHPTFRFEEWGRYAMLWHDGRFLRHTRFRFRIAGSGCPANLLPHAQGVRGLHARVSHGQGQAARVGADPLARSGRCARSSRRWSTRSNRRRPTLA